jgi:PAS domain S-box-containing protein
MTGSLIHVLNKIVETSNNNITITDKHGIILNSNPAHWSLYGMDANHYIGKSVLELEDEGILSPSITASVINNQKPVQILQQTRTGKVIMSTAFPVFDEKGNMSNIISYAQDQTEIKNLQDQYERLQRKIKIVQTEVQELREKEYGKDGMIIRSKQMTQLMKTISRVAQTDVTVLFLGESGVGKSALAHTLHNQSHRSKEPFIEVNCSTIPESLFESEMFGYDAGAFTGALKDGKQGLIEQADGGTLFLDEVGDLPLSMQVKLLKTLQDKKIMRVGGKKEKKIDFRLIVATNKDLSEMVEQKRFRSDLFYRLNVIPVQIPPLRERLEDIPLLIQHYYEKLNLKYNLNKQFHSSTYDHLLNYSWPGNIRELENVIERVLLITEGTTIYPSDLPKVIKETGHVNHLTQDPENDDSKKQSLKQALEQLGVQILTNAYNNCKSTYEIADALGISQPSVIYKFKKYNIGRSK